MLEFHFVFIIICSLFFVGDSVASASNNDWLKNDARDEIDQRAFFGGKTTDEDKDGKASLEEKKAKKSAYSLPKLFRSSSRKKDKAKNNGDSSDSVKPELTSVQKALSVELREVLPRRASPNGTANNPATRSGTPRVLTGSRDLIQSDESKPVKTPVKLEGERPNLTLDLKSIESYEERQKKRHYQSKKSSTRSSSRSPTYKSNSETDLRRLKIVDGASSNESVTNDSDDFDDDVELTHRTKDAGSTPKTESRRSVRDLFTPRSFSPRSPKTPKSNGSDKTVSSPRTPSSSEAQNRPNSPRYLYSPRLFGKKDDSKKRESTKRSSQSSKKEKAEETTKPLLRPKSATDLGFSSNFRQALESVSNNQNAKTNKQIYTFHEEIPGYTIETQEKDKEKSETLLNIYGCLHEDMYAHGKLEGETIRAYVKTYLLYRVFYLEKARNPDGDPTTIVNILAGMEKNMEKALARIIFYTDAHMSKGGIQMQLNKVASYFSYLGDATDLLDGSRYDKTVSSRKIFEKIMDKLPKGQFMMIQNIKRDELIKETFDGQAHIYFKIYKSIIDEEREELERLKVMEKNAQNAKKNNNPNGVHSSQSSSSPQDDTKIAASSSEPVRH